MTKLKITLGVLSVLSFAMLTACGEGFKGSDLLSSTPEPKVILPESELPQGNTVTNVDEQAVAGFQGQRDRLDSSMHEGFARSIEALGVFRGDYTSASGDTTLYSMTMLLGCDSNETIRHAGFVDMNKLRAGETILLGEDSFYKFYLACTDAECEEMAATILRDGPSGTNAVVHYGIKAEAPVFMDVETSYEYIPRPSDADNFYTTNTLGWYLRQCNLADAERAAGEFGSNPGGIDEDLWTSPSADDDLPIFPGSTTTGGSSDPEITVF